jgi:hypothetical protein
MPPHEVVQAQCKRINIEGSDEPGRQRDVVYGYSRDHLIEKPKPLLRERQREGPGIPGFLPQELGEHCPLLFRR